MNPRTGLFTLAAAAILPNLHASITLGDLDSVWQFENDASESNGGSALLPTEFAPVYSGHSIAGKSAMVLDLPALPASSWLQMPNSVGGNGGSVLGRTNAWTIVMDVRFATLETDAALLQTDETNVDDAEFHVMGGAGLQYEYYETGGLSQLPDFDSLEPVSTGTVTSVDLTPRMRDDDFAFRFRGRIRIPADGSYTFHTTSNDGSQLLINGSLVVDNDGLHSSQTRSGTIDLSEGTHEIEVTFFEHTGQAVLSVEYEGPGIARQIIPASVLTHGDAGAIRLGADRIADPASVQLDKWHRLALACSVAGPDLELRAYLDGVQTEVGGIAAVVTKPFDGDYSLPAAVKLFTDDNAQTQGILVNSLAYWGEALTSSDIAALGMATAPGCPDLYVSNNNNEGPGSLRSAIDNVRNGGLISFDLAMSGQTIVLGTNGDLEISGRTIEIDARHLPGMPVVNGAGSFRIFTILSGADVTIRGLGVTNGFHLDRGGAIRNSGILTIERCLITGSQSSAPGGAIRNEAAGTLTVIESTISGNTAGAGGGVSNVGTANFERCTISGNTAASGGGVEVINTTTLINCTVAGNIAADGGGGGFASLGALHLISCTVSDNAASDPFGFFGGGGVLMDFGADVTLENSIVAGNSSNVPAEDNLGGFGTPNLQGANLTGGPPGLEPLGDYGGPTATMPPVDGSRAAGIGRPTANTPATDQRGMPRIDGGLDLGAAETSFQAVLTLFTTWATDNIPPPQDSSFNGDADHDGIENGAEYAFLMDPLAHDPLLAPRAAPHTGTGPGLELRIVIPFQSSSADLAYVLLETTDLQTWNEVYRYDALSGIETVTDLDLVTELDFAEQTITVTAPSLHPVTIFWRVAAQASP